QNLYSKFHDFRGRMRAGKEDTAVVTEDWLDVADAMIRDFRANRVFFPVQKRSLFQGYARGKRRGRGRKEKGKGKKRAREDEEREGEEEDDEEERDEKLLEEMEEIVARLQKFLGIAVDTDASSIPKDYHGIPFEEWLDVFLEYALVLSGQEHAQRQADEIYDTLATAADASVWYHDRKATRQIHVCWFTCALRMKDEETLSTIARWFMKEYQFTTDTYRLFATLSRTCGDPRRSLFHSSPSMKFMLRQIKAIDYTLPNDPFNLTQVRRTRASVFQERAALTTRDEQGNLIPAQDMDVALLLIYGYILYAGTSFTNALNYFFRAYALDPENPATLLSIGLGYIHHSLKRQSDNRHYLIMQGLAFMNEYRRVLSGSTVLQKRQEVEFNFARVWQMLGLAHLAVEGYKKCLEIGKQIRDEFKEKEMNGQDVWREEFTRDAAYALQCIYAFSGDKGSAREVTENWLVI
ncbi:transcription factor TFIIIC subunit tfc4, partial [Ascosphaera atra]